MQLGTWQLAQDELLALRFAAKGFGGLDVCKAPIAFSAVADPEATRIMEHLRSKGVRPPIGRISDWGPLFTHPVSEQRSFRTTTPGAGAQ